jgi:hypothetical protein
MMQIPKQTGTEILEELKGAFDSLPKEAKRQVLEILRQVREDIEPDHQQSAWAGLNRSTGSWFARA